MPTTEIVSPKLVAGLRRAADALVHAGWSDEDNAHKGAPSLMVATKPWMFGQLMLTLGGEVNQHETSEGVFRVLRLDFDGFEVLVYAPVERELRRPASVDEALMETAA